jgi:transcriptional regulator with XRE-family HTH domain
MKLHNEQIGQRLAELRKTLAADSGQDLPQTKLAQELNVTQDVVYRLEKGTGSIENLTKILLYYHHKGYNMLWVLVPDNEDLPKYQCDYQNTQNTTANPEVLKALEKLSSLLKGKHQ